jgi:transcriptional regulator with XRE-family HTH domain
MICVNSTFVSLIRARIAAGWTLKELAKRLGISEQQVQKYECHMVEARQVERAQEEVPEFLIVSAMSSAIIPASF